jgi:TonB family protein
LDANKIKRLANEVFKENTVELVMKPAAGIKASENKKVVESKPSVKLLTILDGVEITDEQYKSFSISNCKAMMKLSPQASFAKYGEKGKNGALIINTKPATEDTPVNYTDDAVFMKTEVMPEFPGGVTAMKDWITKNSAYPDELKSKNIHGFVIVNFVVNTQGKVVKANVIKSLDPEIDEFALNMVKKMPEWKPGMNNGKAVNVFYTVPLRF